MKKRTMKLKVVGMREVSYLVVLLVFVTFSLQPVFGLVQPYGSDAVLVSGIENLTSFYSQLKTIYPNWTYYDSSTGEYVLNSTALPGGDLYIYLDNGAKLIIDKPLRVENTVQYPIPEPYSEKELRSISSVERSLEIYSRVVISMCPSCSDAALEIRDTTLNIYRMTPTIRVKHVNIINSVIRGYGQHFAFWYCLNPCDDPSFTGTGGCCHFNYCRSGLSLSSSEGVISNLTIDSLTVRIYAIRSIDLVRGVNGATLYISPSCGRNTTVTINRITGNYVDEWNSGVLINNRWTHCSIEVTNGNWNGAVSLLTSDTSGNLIVKDTFVRTSDKNNIRIWGDVTLVNTTLDPPSDGKVNFTDINSDTTIKINSRPKLHVYDSKGVAILANGVRTKIMPNGTHIFASSGVNVTKYSHIVFKVTDGSVELVNISKYNIGKEYKFTLSSYSHTQPVTVNVSGFKPNSAINVYYIKNGKKNLFGTFYTKDSDWIKFTYNRGFSEVTFDVVYAGSVIASHQTSNDDNESETTDQQTTSYDNVYSDSSTTQDTGTTSSSVGLAPPEGNDNGITLVLIASMAVLIAVWITSRR